MKNLLLILCFLLLALNCYAQEEIDSLAYEGIKLHDKGEYEKAIEIYKKALAIDSLSAGINYEMAVTYMSLKDYDNVIKHSDIVIAQNNQNLMHAYIAKASALDYMGRTKESIAVFEEVIEKFGDYYLLHYNLAYSCYNIKEYEKAEKALINAISSNSYHGSSHFLLGFLMANLGNKTKSLLCLHYFLLLEPNTERSKTAYNLLQEQFNGNVEQDAHEPNKFNVFMNSNSKDTVFRSIDLMISLLEATKTIETNKDKSEEELFVENTKTFFDMLGNKNDEKKYGIWWNLYIPFFNELAKSDYLETYCYYISQSSNEKAAEWVEEHDEEVEEFLKWAFE